MPIEKRKLWRKSQARNIIKGKWNVGKHTKQSKLPINETTYVFKSSNMDSKNKYR